MHSVFSTAAARLIDFKVQFTLLCLLFNMNGKAATGHKWQKKQTRHEVKEH